MHSEHFLVMHLELNEIVICNNWRNYSMRAYGQVGPNSAGRRYDWTAGACQISQHSINVQECLRCELNGAPNNVRSENSRLIGAARGKNKVPVEERTKRTFCTKWTVRNELQSNEIIVLRMAGWAVGMKEQKWEQKHRNQRLVEIIWVSLRRIK